MPKVKEYQTITILGDQYKIRKTFDVVDYANGIYGYDVHDLDREFLLHYDCEKVDKLIKYLQWRTYKIYA